uniref:Nodule-specific cysteine-rich peptide G38 n=1 Tax=Pisum sativum TaxID=3888 RepID=A0A7T8IG47_PEA|nr:nodule-specific cysteine-rich peptide G38 [Pisum sativum]
MNFLSNRGKLYSISHIQSGKIVAKILKIFYIYIVFSFIVLIPSQGVGDHNRIKCETEKDCPRNDFIDVTLICLDNFCIFLIL